MIRWSTLVLSILSAICALFAIDQLRFWLGLTSALRGHFAAMEALFRPTMLLLLFQMGFFISLAVTMLIGFFTLSRGTVKNFAPPRTLVFATAAFAACAGLVDLYVFSLPLLSSPSIEQEVEVIGRFVNALAGFAVAFALVLLGSPRSNSIKLILIMSAAVALLSCLHATIDFHFSFAFIIGIATYLCLALVLFQLVTSNANLVAERRGKNG